MKLTKLSLAAVMALGFTSAAMADVDVQFGGQAVLYYQTLDGDAGSYDAATDTGTKTERDIFDQDAARGNVGLQIRSKADLGNDFQAGVTANIIGTLGLENNLVSGVMQNADAATNNDLGDFWLPEAYVAKTFKNTTVKLGRQYLNTPLAFSEGWNVFKNSFEAAVLVNKDLPDTTVVLAMVNKANDNGVGAEMSTFNSVNNAAIDNTLNRYGLDVGLLDNTDDAAVYTLGILNNSIENLNIGLWGYQLTSVANAFWLDASYKLNAGDYPITIALQGAQLSADNDTIEDLADANDLDDKTTMWGAKVGTKVQGWGLSVAYNSVNDGIIPMQNVSTGVKTKLFVQQILNQNAIKQDADTWQLKVVTPEFSGVKFIAQYSMTDAGDANINWKDAGEGNDMNELDLIAKTKVAGIDLMVAYVYQDYDKDNYSLKTANLNPDGSIDTANATYSYNEDSQSLFRVVARYSF